MGLFYVRNDKGQAVPLSSVVEVKPRNGPEFTMRYTTCIAAR